MSLSAYKTKYIFTLYAIKIDEIDVNKIEVRLLVPFISFLISF